MSLPQSAIPNPHSAILLVEDNPDDALLVQRAVRKANLPNPVRVVEDGQAAMDYLAACRDDPVGRLHPVGDVPPERLYPMPTLVLLDLNLPRKSGFEVLAWLREQPRLRHLPVVVLTSSKDIPTIERAFGLGANAFLVKPPAPESLGDLVTSLAAEFERPPRVLLIDDSPDDRALAMRELRRAFPGLQAVEIDSADGLAAALEAGDFDLVISDVSMPWATGLGNLRAFKARWPDCPVIILTGTGSEQIAAESITAGLDDYVLKSPHHIARLPLAARSALGRARQRCELRESEARYRDLVENSQDLICTHDLEGQLLSVNEAAVRLTGYPHEALLRMNLADLLVPDVRRTFDAYLKKIRATGQARGLMQIQTAGGETRYWGYSNTLRTEGVPQPIVRGMARDVTERVRAEE
ncbi:MAG: response regulator, partial [Chloroflexi bacterium]|nr:response regulator [Chloroflexota bacterium]